MRGATLLVILFLAPGAPLLAQRLPPNPLARAGMALATPSLRPMISGMYTMSPIPSTSLSGWWCGR